MPTSGNGFWSSFLRYLCFHKKFLFRSFCWRHYMWFAVWAPQSKILATPMDNSISFQGGIEEKKEQWNLLFQEYGVNQLTTQMVAAFVWLIHLNVELQKMLLQLFTPVFLPQLLLCHILINCQYPFLLVVSDGHSGAPSAATFSVVVAAAPLLFFVTSDKRQRRCFFSQKSGSSSALFFEQIFCRCRYC